MSSGPRRGRRAVTPNQQTITRYLDGFRTDEHARIPA